MNIVLTELQTKSLVDNILNEDSSKGEGIKYLYNFINDLTGKKVNPNPNTDTEISPEITNGNEMMNPLGHKVAISSPFGKRNSIGTKNHKGVDFATPSGSKVFSPYDGTVIDAKDTTPNGCGGFVMIDHVNFKTKFCHLRQWTVNKGDTVKKGQLIGYSGGGKTDPYRGTSTGSHLHYEILGSDNIAMNPTNVQSNLV